MRDPESDIVRLAAEVADRSKVDWDAASTECPDVAGILKELQTVETLSRLQDGESLGAWMPETWGSLRLLECIATGGFGEIYRAFDPVLQREVALKLLRVDRTPPGAARLRYLAEARRLARIRHPNVVTVHGADDHEGRVGLWMELVRGSTLEECLGRQGPFDVGEACAIGTALCRALAAVHAAGLVHCDVKTANVIREDGGRVVLLDLGAANETPTGRAACRALSGTLLSMAPEQVRGEAVGPPADLYALGVLLYRLVSGRYPIKAGNLAELLAAFERGERTPLADVRPDLPADFTRVVERALEFDPARRFATAGEIEQALLEAQGKAADPGMVGHARSGGAALRSLALWSAAVLVGVGGLIAGGWRTGLIRPAATIEQTPVLAAPELEAAQRVVPAREPTVAGPAGALIPGVAVLAPVEVRARLFRHAGAVDQPLGPSARVGTGDSLFMTLSGSEPLNVYVVNEDDSGGVFVLFPLADLDLRNPLAAHHRHRLPGTRRGRTLDWTVGKGSGRETVVVIASREPLDELESALTAMPRTVPARAASDNVATASVEHPLRGIDGLAEEPPSASDAARRLILLVNSLGGRGRGGTGPWVWRVTLEHSAP